MIKGAITARGNGFWICKSDAIQGSVIFYPEAWSDSQNARVGISVALSKLSEGAKGWRAGYARVWQPSDKQESQ